MFGKWCHSLTTDAIARNSRTNDVSGLREDLYQPFTEDQALRTHHSFEPGVARTVCGFLWD
jgi:hypothetical protein